MMEFKLVSVILIVVVPVVLCAKRGSSCSTPNGEGAKCIAITSCKVIYDALGTADKAAIEFAQQSQCGYDTDPLVCCGTTAYKKTSGRGSPCTTPHNEKAKCTPLTQCSVIANTISTDNPTAIDFAKRSQCGYDSEPLVCCGKKDYAFGTKTQTNKPSLSSLLPDRSICGREMDENRVFGGVLTAIGEFPWMCLLKYKNLEGVDVGFKCGGSLINNRYVLTAAHCVVVNSYAGFDVDSVRLGEWRISTNPDCEGTVIKECANTVVDVKVEKVIPHLQYSRRTGKNDIALIRLKQHVPYTDYIRAICLPYPEDPYPADGILLLVAGWGATENSSASDYKLKVQLPVISKADCETKIRQRARITDNHLCAGGIRGKDSCQGDSGGPLMNLIVSAQQTNQFIQEGVVSYGVGCGVQGYPGIYTRVVKYISWITANLVA